MHISKKLMLTENTTPILVHLSTVMLLTFPAIGQTKISCYLHSTDQEEELSKLQQPLAKT